MNRLIIRKDTYLDSVFLMSISAELHSRSVVQTAADTGSARRAPHRRATDQRFTLMLTFLQVRSRTASALPGASSAS